MTKHFTIFLTALLAASILAACGTDNVTTQSNMPTSLATTTTTASTYTAPSETNMAWGRISDQSRIFGGAGMQVLRCVLQGGPGLLVSGGSESNGEADAAIWMSSNGLDWSRVPDESNLFGGTGIQLINSMTKGGPGYVAVGQDDPEGSPAKGWVDSDAAVWVSDDGSAWTRVTQDEAVFGGPGSQRMMSVTSGGPGLVAVGSDYKDGAAWPDVAVWVSADGYTWVRVSDEKKVFGGPGGQEALSVATLGSVVVAVGSSESYENAAVWVSADGYAWNRVPHEKSLFGGQGRQEMVSVVAHERGLVAVGADGSSGDDDVIVWISADGYTWTRIQDRTVFGGPGNQSASCMAAWEEGLLLLGGDEANGDLVPAAWSSVDGSIWKRVDEMNALDGKVQGFSSLTAWESGLVAVGWDESGEDTDGAVWMSPPPGD